MEILFTNGIADNMLTYVVVEPQGILKVLFSGSSNVLNNLKKYEGSFHELVFDGQKKPQSFSLNYWPDIIVNQISDPDTHGIALAKCKSFCESQGKPVLNRPENIVNTRRDLVARLFQSEEGILMPGTIRINPLCPGDIVKSAEEAGLEFPLIIREAGHHGGISTSLCTKKDELEQQLFQYALDGRAYYLTNFVDYQSTDGYYRKYRIAMIGGEPVLRHLVISDDWMVHASNRELMDATPELQAEEERLITEFHGELLPKISPALDLIYKKMDLDYFGIDCSINEKNELIIFEINANMNILFNNKPSPNIWETPVSQIEQKLMALITHKAQG